MSRGGPGKPRMTKPLKPQRLFNIYALAEKFPGITLTGMAKLMGSPRGTVQSAICRMDVVGLLLYEDDMGSLYPFRVVGRRDAEALWRQVWS
jgi:Mn-dependent DtxR family transcriptional regulator